MIFVCDGKLNTLQGFRGRASFHAEHGKDGAPLFRNGGAGSNVVIKVPPGTVIYEKDDRKLVHEMDADGQTFVVARGGEGGLGNGSIKSSRNKVSLNQIKMGNTTLPAFLLKHRAVSTTCLLPLPFAGHPSTGRREAMVGSGAEAGGGCWPCGMP